MHKNSKKMRTKYSYHTQYFCSKTKKILSRTLFLSFYIVVGRNKMMLQNSRKP